jgi:ATP-dependent Zn protease
MTGEDPTLPRLLYSITPRLHHSISIFRFPTSEFANQSQEIDEEVKNILNRAYTEAKEILEQHRDQLEIVTKDLLDKETLDAQAFNRLIGRSPQLPDK